MDHKQHKSTKNNIIHKITKKTRQNQITQNQIHTYKTVKMSDLSLLHVSPSYSLLLVHTFLMSWGTNNRISQSQFI